MNGRLDLLGDPRRMKTWILIVILAIFFSSNDGEWRVWKKDRRKDSLEFHATSWTKIHFFQVHLCIIPKLIWHLSVLKGELYGKWLLIFTIITDPESLHQPPTCWKWYFANLSNIVFLPNVLSEMGQTCSQISSKVGKQVFAIKSRLADWTMGQEFWQLRSKHIHCYA